MSSLTTIYFSHFEDCCVFQSIPGPHCNTDGRLTLDWAEQAGSVIWSQYNCTLGWIIIFILNEPWLCGWLTDWLSSQLCSSMFVPYSAAATHTLTLMCWSFLKWRHHNVPNFMILDMMFNAWSNPLYSLSQL